MGAAAARFASIAVIILLLASLAAEFWLLPAVVAGAGEAYPEVQPIQVPTLIWGVIVISCWQAALVLILVAIRRARAQERPGVLAGWIAGLLLVILALAVAEFITLGQLGFGTPLIMFGLIAMALIAVAGLVTIAIVVGTRVRAHA